MSKSNTHADLHDGTNYVQDLELLNNRPRAIWQEKFPSQGKQLLNMANEEGIQIIKRISNSTNLLSIQESTKGAEDAEDAGGAWKMKSNNPKVEVLPIMSPSEEM